MPFNLGLVCLFSHHYSKNCQSHILTFQGLSLYFFNLVHSVKLMPPPLFLTGPISFRKANYKKVNKNISLLLPLFYFWYLQWQLEPIHIFSMSIIYFVGPFWEIGYSGIPVNFFTRSVDLVLSFFPSWPTILLDCKIKVTIESPIKFIQYLYFL